MQGHGTGPAADFLDTLTVPGHLCVQYFFALSGFVMVSVHHRDFGHIAAIPRYYWLRMCRIYPAYWLALCIPMVYLYGTLTPGSAASVILLDPWHQMEFIPAAWTLRYEFVFYLMFGLCMLPYVGKPLLAYWIILTCWRWNFSIPLFRLHTQLLLVPNWYAVHYAYKFVDFYDIYFFGGMAAGYAYVKLRLGWRACAGLAVAGVLLLLWLLPAEDWGARYGAGSAFNLGISLAIGAIMLGFAGLERGGIVRLGRWAGWLGMMSYPLYIFHQPVMLLTDNLLRWGTYQGAEVYLRLAALILAMLVLSGLVTFLFDQPVQRRLRLLTRRIWPEPRPAPARLSSATTGG